MVEKEIDGRTATLGTDLLCGGEIFARKGEEVTLLDSFAARDGTHYVVIFEDGRRTDAAAYELTITPDRQIITHRTNWGSQ